MHPVRLHILDLMEEYGLDNRISFARRRNIVTSILSHFPDTTRRRARAILDRTLAHPEERRGGSHGGGAPLKNTNRLGKKKG